MLLLISFETLHNFFPVTDDDVLFFEEILDFRISKQFVFPVALLP